jgi:hypothetical protein
MKPVRAEGESDRDWLTRLIEWARTLPPMTPAEVREQKISFIYGQLMDCAPDMTREEVAARYDVMYGKLEEKA